MKKNKVIFLDRDGTINVDKNYVYKIEDFELIDGVIEGLRILQDQKFKLIVISNQSGIERGFYSKDEADVLFNYMIDLLKSFDITIDKFYYCPHLNTPCSCRKPKLDLFYQAQKEFNIDFNSSYAIGDKLRDLSICSTEAVKGFLITRENIKNIPKDVETCESLLAAAKKIKNIERRKYGNNHTV